MSEARLRVNTAANDSPKKRKNVAKKAAGTTKAVSKSSDDLSAPERIYRRIADLGDWRGARLALIGRLIHEVNPEVVEDWK